MLLGRTSVRLFAPSTIDFSLAIAQVWRRGYLHHMQRQIGYSIPAITFIKSDAGVTIYRPQSDQRRLIKNILPRLVCRSSWFQAQLERQGLRLDSLDQALASPQSNWSYVRSLLRVSGELLPLYVVTHWLSNAEGLRRLVNSQTVDAVWIRSQGYYDRVDRVIGRLFRQQAAAAYRKYYRVFTITELRNLFVHRTYPQLHTLNQRQQGYILANGILRSGVTQVGTVLNNLGMRLPLRRIPKYTALLTGRSVYHGLVRGRVVVVRGKGQLTKMRQGAVLVTAMTTPDFALVVKRARALVTDFGGRLCHAAILAREYKVPCVVGTEIATKMFHDGDVVEVDATHGTVRLIKQSRSR